VTPPYDDGEDESKMNEILPAQSASSTDQLVPRAVDRSHLAQSSSMLLLQESTPSDCPAQTATVRAPPTGLQERPTTNAGEPPQQPIETTNFQQAVNDHQLSADQTPASTKEQSRTLLTRGRKQYEDCLPDPPSKKAKTTTTYNLPSQKPPQLSVEEWRSWQARYERYTTSGVVSRPDLSFEEYLRQRQACRDPKHRASHYLLRIGFFCNNDRLEDPTTQQLQTAVGDLPKLGKVLAIFLHRMAGSPRNEEHPPASGAAGILDWIKKGAPGHDFIRSLPFSNRHTYHAVLNRDELSVIAITAAQRLASIDTVSTLKELVDQIIRTIQEVGGERAEELAALHPNKKRTNNTQKALHFHSLQIALDLWGFGVIEVQDDARSCPLATGSKAGLEHVKRWEGRSETIVSLATRLDLPAPVIQTTLCEYDKFVRWYSGVDPVRMRESIAAKLQSGQQAHQ
jgi:hypothetical protein